MSKAIPSRNIDFSLGSYLNGQYTPAHGRRKRRSTAAIRLGISEGTASTAGGQPNSRSVWLVVGPMEIAETPANGHAISATRAASARCVALDELVKVAASNPSWTARRRRS